MKSFKNATLEQEPSGDVISRQIISDYVGSHILEINTGYGDLNKHTNEILRMIVDYIGSMPPVKPTQNWIPVSERVPEEDGRYLVTMKGISNYFYISTTSYAKDLHKVDRYDFKSGIGDGWYNYDGEYGYYKIDNVVAWMPLPPSYERSEES